MKPAQLLSIPLLLAAAAFCRPAAAAQSLTPRQKTTIEQLTSVFENSTTDFRYDYIEDIDDGAGITCGRVGFTVGELLIITERYAAAKGPETPLAGYIPCLKKMGADISKDYSCLFPSVPKEQLAAPGFKLEGGLISKADFGQAWVQAGSDPVMKKIQDDYVDETYFKPAVKEAARLGLRTPLGLAFVYDAMIQMDTDPLFAAIQGGFAAMHFGRVTPRGETEEAEWLRLYLAERKKELSVTPAGAATTPRVDALGQILDDMNLYLTLPIEFRYVNEHFRLAAGRN